MRTIKLSDLHARAKHRPEGYVQHVLSLAEQVTDTHYVLSDANYALLCAHYAAKPIPLTPKRIAHGAVGLVKGAAIVVKQAVKPNPGLASLIEHRVKTCRACDQFDGRQCRICKCQTWAKVRNAGEKCPLGKW